MKNRRKRCQKAAQEPPIWHLKTGLPPKRSKYKPIKITPDMTNPELVKKIREMNRKRPSPVVIPVNRMSFKRNSRLKHRIYRKNSAAARKG